MSDRSDSIDIFSQMLDKLDMVVKTEGKGAPLTRQWVTSSETG